MPRQRRNRDGQPFVMQRCPDCQQPPKGELDMLWFNEPDPTRSRWVCGDCWHKLTSELHAATLTALHGQQPPGQSLPLEEARQRLAEQVRIAHVCKWVHVRQEVDGSDVFFCEGHPDGPNLIRVTAVPA